jgi:hypothetical protein
VTGNWPAFRLTRPNARFAASVNSWAAGASVPGSSVSERPVIASLPRLSQPRISTSSLRSAAEKRVLNRERFLPYTSFGGVAVERGAFLK